MEESAIVTTLEARHPNLRDNAEAACLLFMGHPVFTVEVWYDDGLYYVQPQELDLVASAPTREEAIVKAGQMIMDLFMFLHEEINAEDLTESEDEALMLITRRLGPVLMHYHEAEGRRSLRAALRKLIRPAIEWKLASSTRDGSAPVLSA